ncbi:hypothetical protein [Streptomyces sp. KL116D]|uniref:hypothetical protein n=1 Tax=Streptomyces sp. KL116D TaxID=3045152 RepID=UPI003556C7C5
MADHGTAPPITVTEPRLATRRARGRRRHPWHILVATPLAVAGLVALTVTGNALRPFDRIDVIEAKMASSRTTSRTPRSSACC